MSTPNLKAVLLQLLADDEALYAQLCAEGFIPVDESALSHGHLETARVVGTLVHELEVNWPGVEVILRMRTELIETRRQVHELAQVLRAQRGGGVGGTK